MASIWPNCSHRIRGKHELVEIPWLEFVGSYPEVETSLSTGRTEGEEDLFNDPKNVNAFYRHADGKNEL